MFGLSTIKLVIYAVIVAAIFAAGVAAGIAFDHPRAIAEGHRAGVAETTQFYAGKLEQQEAQAKHDFDDAVAHNNQLKDDYAKLKAQWQIDHDAAKSTQDALTHQLAVRGADNDRLRRLFASAAASGPRCPSAATAAQADTRGSGGISIAAAGSVRSGVAEVPEQSGPFDVIADILRRADDVVTVANECSAALKTP